MEPFTNQTMSSFCVHRVLQEKKVHSPVPMDWLERLPPMTAVGIYYSCARELKDYSKFGDCTLLQTLYIWETTPCRHMYTNNIITKHANLTIKRILM